jgi:lipopolysaccharide transport protein LptA
VTTLFRYAYAETNISLEFFQIEPETNIEITSDSMLFNSKEGVTKFFDTVNVSYGRLVLKAKSLTVSKSKDLSNSSSLKFFATGPITINNGNNFIQGDEATFTEENQELLLIGNVSIFQESNTIYGDRLVLNLKEGVAQISGSVKTVIGPVGKK